MSDAKKPAPEVSVVLEYLRAAGAALPLDERPALKALTDLARPPGPPARPRCDNGCDSISGYRAGCHRHDPVMRQTIDAAATLWAVLTTGVKVCREDGDEEGAREYEAALRSFSTHCARTGLGGVDFREHLRANLDRLLKVGGQP